MDLLIVLGSRLDIRQTGADVESFSQNKIIIHVDIEYAELNNRVKTDYAINADLVDFFDKIFSLLIKTQFGHKKLD